MHSVLFLFVSFIFFLSLGLDNLHTHNCRSLSLPEIWCDSVYPEKNLTHSFFYAWCITPGISQSLRFFYVNSHYLRRTSFQKIIPFQNYQKNIKLNTSPIVVQVKSQWFGTSCFLLNLCFKAQHWLLVKGLKIHALNAIVMKQSFT